MDLPKFEERDFAILTIDGFEPRMTALRKQIRPKLEALGQCLAPFLSQMLEEEVCVHVAKHARRTVNPPDSTWVAFSTNKRGYKSYPHFQIGMWSTHLFAQFALIYEAADFKPLLARHLREEADTLTHLIPAAFYWSTDHTKPDVIPHRSVSRETLLRIANQLEQVKKTEALCGRQWMRQESILHHPDALQKALEETFVHLLPLYRMSSE